MPVGAVREIYPFSQLIEIPEMDANLKMELDSGIEQLSAVMLDQEHIEVKAAIHLDLLAFAEQKIDNIEELEEEALDMERLQNSPGLVGYIAKSGEDLWQIAKENHTTIRDIMETNGWKEKQLAPGDTILIVKRVGLDKIRSEQSAGSALCFFAAGQCRTKRNTCDSRIPLLY